MRRCRRAEKGSGMEGQLGILVGGRTELALFTAINSLPLTAYHFLFFESLASWSSVFSILLAVPTRASSFSSPLSGPTLLRLFETISVFSFSGTFPFHKNVAETALNRKWWESMGSACLSATRDARTHVRAHTSSLTASLCSREFEMQNGNASGRR